jgi:hypothetical protein
MMAMINFMSLPRPGTASPRLPLFAAPNALALVGADRPHKNPIKNRAEFAGGPTDRICLRNQRDR